jgi:acetolactate synthase-1/2/3 large subunit
MGDRIKVSDAIANFLKEKEIRHVFGIVGAANSHIFDSIFRLGYTEIVCVHHEQAATMAMQTYYRTCGKITAAIVTAGGGSTNAVTGVVSAWADSIPGVVISGQENTKFIDKMQGMRMWGIQGYDSTHMVEQVTKYAVRVMKAERGVYELAKAYAIAGSGRPGPVWVDYPMDIQGSVIPAETLLAYDEAPATPIAPPSGQVRDVLTAIKEAKRPVLWLGNGIRLAGAQSKVKDLLSLLPFPTITAWAGLDLLETDHPLNHGHAGNYGNRSANFVVQNSDLIIAMGTRLSIPMVGYEHAEFARAAKVVMVDADETELAKLADKLSIAIHADAGRFLDELLGTAGRERFVAPDIAPWLARCEAYRKKYPLVGPEHADQNGFINSYRFIDRLCDHFKRDQIITTDMGTALLSGHEAIRLKAGQRLMTSTGLGEMGYGLPAAMGASFARDRGEVLCLNCDGGMMMNLQELQTVAHHRLPIKIVVFNNDGYLMIKHTQKNLFAGKYSGSTKESGVSCPDFSKIAQAFDLPYYRIKTWEDFDTVVGQVQAADSALICEVFMDPEQAFYPKLGLAMGPGGKIVSPPLEDLSPLLPREELRENMIVGMHPKSEGLKP